MSTLICLTMVMHVRIERQEARETQLQTRYHLEVAGVDRLLTMICATQVKGSLIFRWIAMGAAGLL